MSTVIKNGTIVTHDLTYKSDILIDGSTILEIGPNLKGNNQLDASDCYIMPGGIDVDHGCHQRVRNLELVTVGMIRAVNDFEA